MLTLKIACVGKIGDNWLEEGIQMYLTRMQGRLKVVHTWLKDDSQFANHLTPHTFALDPAGKQFTSEQLATFLEQRWIEGGSQITCLIGGATGLPLQIRTSSIPLISLSQLTFPHHLARLVFIEQVYRSLEIIKGSPYHK